MKCQGCGSTDLKRIQKVETQEHKSRFSIRREFWFFYEYECQNCFAVLPSNERELYDSRRFSRYRQDTSTERFAEACWKVGASLCSQGDQLRENIRSIRKRMKEEQLP